MNYILSLVLYLSASLNLMLKWFSLGNSMYDMAILGQDKMGDDQGCAWSVDMIFSLYFLFSYLTFSSRKVYYKYTNPLIIISFKDREFVELEMTFNGQTKRPESPSPLASPVHSQHSGGGGGSGSVSFLQSCCGSCCSQRYQVRMLLTFSFI